ncbi:hypothetical protein Tco_1457676 [Tanacetum coccineum]
MGILYKSMEFEVELHGAQGDRKAEVFQVSNDDNAVAQRWLDDKQPEEKTNTDCLVKEQKKEYQTGWNIKMGNVLDSCNQRSIQHCMKSGVAKHLVVAGIQQQNGLVNETNMTLLAKVVLYKNMSFNESGEYKKTMIGSGVGTGSTQVLHGFEFEVEPLGDHTFEVEPQDNVDQGAEDSDEASFAVAAVKKSYVHKSLTFNNTIACKVISKWKAGLKDDMYARSDVYVLSNGCRKCNDDSDGYYWEYTPGMFIHLFLYIDDMVFSCGCKAEIWVTKGLLDKAKENVLGMEIVKDQSGNTLKVSQSRFYNGKLVQTLLEGHSILSLEGSLLGNYDVEKNGKWSCIYAVRSQEYQMVCTRLDIASVDVGSLNTNLQHMKALLTTKAGYMTFTEAWKKEIWLKGLLTELRYEIRLVAGIATRALVKGDSRSKVPAQVEVAAYRSQYRIEGDDVGSLGLKDFKMILRVTTAQLQLLSDYYCWKDYADRDEIKD